ncbi:MAG TPA: gas vesicle protein K [Vicinamibacterales bacterium]|nr:gas vesicle protein K [Vicinamibacterales bacterium]
MRKRSAKHVAARKTAAARKPRKRVRAARRRAQAAGTSPIEVREIETLRDEIERVARSAKPPRWNANPEDVRRSVAKLVLTLIELVRQLLERQAIRRVEAGTLTADETEAIGVALMRLEETVRDIGAQFDLAPEDLNIDLGPVGKLL